MNGRAQELRQLVSGRTKDKQRSKSSLGKSVKEWAEELAISKIVAAHSSGMQRFLSIRYNQGSEVSHLQCCRGLSAIVAWRCTGACKWVGSDVVAFSDGKV